MVVNKLTEEMKDVLQQKLSELKNKYCNQTLTEDNNNSEIKSFEIPDEAVKFFDDDTGDIIVDKEFISDIINIKDKIKIIFLDEDGESIQYFTVIGKTPSGDYKLEWICGGLNESALMEGPRLRNIGRAIADKFKPGNGGDINDKEYTDRARARHSKDHDKDADEHRKKKAPRILNKDFDTKSQDYKFYLGDAKNPKPMNYDQWRAKFDKPADELTDQEYAQWYNAIVTDPHGYMIRRGSEDMSKRLQTYQPGKNDTVLKMYRWGDGSSNDDPVPPGPVPPVPPDPVPPDPVPPDPKPDPTPDPDPKPDPKPKPGEKKPRGAGVDPLKRFKQLCKLTWLRVCTLNSKDFLPQAEIEKITLETIGNFRVIRADRAYPLPKWLQMAINQKFLPPIKGLTGQEKPIKNNSAEELKKGPEEPLPVSGVEESLNINEAWDDGLLQSVEDLYDQMIGNESEEFIDEYINDMQMIAKKFGLQDERKLVSYVDFEGCYTPNSAYGITIPDIEIVSRGKYIEYQCGDIRFFVTEIDSMPVLYFRNEAEGEEYLSAIDELNELY